MAGRSPARRLGGLHRRRGRQPGAPCRRRPGARSGAGAADVEAAAGTRRPVLPVHEPGPRQRGGRHRRRDGGRPVCARRDAGRAPTADAMVSLGEPLAVMVADCVPVVLVGDRAGGEARSSAVVHAGRPGVAAGVVPAAVDADAGPGRGRHQRLDRPVRLRTLLRGPRGHARATSPPACPPPGAPRPGARPAWTCRPASAASSQDAGVAVEYSGGCTLEDERAVLLPPRPGHRPVRRAGVDGPSR